MTDDATAARATGDESRRPRRRSRTRRVLVIAALSVAGILIAGIIGILIWSQVGVMDAEPGPLDAVRADDRIAMSEVDGSVVLEPASGPEQVGLVFGSYCGTDLSDSAAPVLSLSGSEDGLTTPQKVDDNRHLLPADATFVEIPGASHASFGDYGPQAGDGMPTISDPDMRADVTAALSQLVAALPR